MIYRTNYDCRTMPPELPEEARIEIAKHAVAREIAEMACKEMEFEYDRRLNIVRGTWKVGKA